MGIDPFSAAPVDLLWFGLTFELQSTLDKIGPLADFTTKSGDRAEFAYFASHSTLFWCRSVAKLPGLKLVLGPMAALCCFCWRNQPAAATTVFLALACVRGK